MNMSLGIVYRDNDRALFWRLPDQGETAPYLTARNIFPGDYAALQENKIAVVSVHQDGETESLRQLFTMVVGQSTQRNYPLLSKTLIPDLLRSPSGQEFVAMLRREAAVRVPA